MFLTAFLASTLLHAAPADTLRPACDDVRLDEASVTALKGSATRSSTPTMRVTAADIERRGTITLTEVLRTLAGVSVKDYGGIGGLKTVSIRSFGAQHTGVCYDGIAQTDAVNGQVDISRFNLDAMQTIRVDVAGSDDIFRPAKLAAYVGVVSMETSQGAAEAGPHTSATAALRCGSFGTVSPYVHLRQSTRNSWNIGAWGNYIHSDGDYPFRLRNGALVTDEVRLNSQVSQGAGEAYANGRLGRLGTLRLKASTYVSSRGLPGSVILYTQHPTEHLWDRNYAFSAQHTKEWGSAWRLRTSLAYTNVWNRYLDTPAGSPLPEDDRYRQQQFSLSSVALWQPVPTLSFSLAEDVDVAHLESNLPESVKPTRNTSNTALSAKFATSRFTAVGTLLGLLRWEEREVAPGSPPMPSSVDSRLSPTVSASYRLLTYNPLTDSGTDLRLRAGYKESYRLPSFTDLYYLRVGNRYLDPERADQFNVGVTWQHHFGKASSLFPPTFSLTFDAYYNHVRDKIVAIPTMFIWHMRNVGRVRMTGIDLTASYRAPLAPWLTLHADANYSFQHAIDVTDAAAKNYRHQIAYTPRHSGSAVVSTVFPWFTASYTLVAVGERYSLAQNTPAYRIAPYADHSVSLNRTFDLHRFRLHVSVEALNLGGRNYEIVKYYPMPGRQWRATLRFSY